MSHSLRSTPARARATRESGVVHHAAPVSDGQQTAFTPIPVAGLVVESPARRESPQSPKSSTGPRVDLIRRDYWEDDTYKYFGFSADRMKAAARKQHQPETCWAACLAIASALVGADEWNNEMKWYQLAKRNDLLSKPPRIKENEFLEFARNISALRMSVYNKNDLAPHMAQRLAENHVILLWSEGHSVVLGRSWSAKINPTTAMFSVIDPAVGQPEDWTLQQVIGFTDTYVVDITKGRG